MIASLRGQVAALGMDHVVIDCGGVGYLVVASPRTLSGLIRGEQAFLLTEMVVKEDSMTLYGFADSESREMFSVLQTVKGLGPRLAMTALGALSPAEIAGAVTTNNPKALQVIPGVGKRVADRMVLELKDKVDRFAGDDPQAGTAGPVTVVTSGVAADVLQALASLGFDGKMAETVVAGVVADDPDAGVSTVLKASLKQLGR